MKDCRGAEMLTIYKYIYKRQNECVAGTLIADFERRMTQQISKMFFSEFSETRISYFPACRIT